MDNSFQENLVKWLYYLAYLLLIALGASFGLLLIGLISVAGDGMWGLFHLTSRIVGGYLVLALIWYLAAHIQKPYLKYPLFIVVILLSFPIIEIYKRIVFDHAWLSPAWLFIYWNIISPERFIPHFDNMFYGQWSWHEQLNDPFFFYGLVNLFAVWLFTIIFLWPKASKVENMHRRRLYQASLIYISIPMIDIKGFSVVTTILTLFIGSAPILRLEFMALMLYPLVFYISISWISLYVKSKKAE